VTSISLYSKYQADQSKDKKNIWNLDTKFAINVYITNDESIMSREKIKQVHSQEKNTCS
jgi:hypothetical protein